MTRTRNIAIAALALSATATATANAQTTTIDFTAAAPEVVIDDFGLFNFQDESTAIGNISFDQQDPSGLTTPGFGFGIALFQLNGFQASFDGGINADAGAAIGVLENNAIDAVTGNIVDKITFTSTLQVEFPEEIVQEGQLNLVLTGNPDWFDSTGELPDTDAFGLDIAESATLSLAFNNNETPDVVDTDGDGIPDTVVGGGPDVGLTSIVSFQLTALILDGVIVRNFEGEVDLLLPGDTNGDNIVGPNDLFTVLANLGSTNATLEQGDVTGDNQVTPDDLFRVLANFGTRI